MPNGAGTRRSVIENRHGMPARFAAKVSPLEHLFKVTLQCQLLRFGPVISKAILALTFLGSVAAHAQTEAALTWTQHPTLTWGDFRGRQPESASYPSALSDTGFKYQLVCRNGILDIDAAAFFSPSGSWVKPNDKNAELLKHEQGHFDMAEVYALKLRKAIRDAKIGCQNAANANAAGEKMVGEFQKDWQNAERQYEEGTQFGTEVERQDAASKKIAADLDVLSAYKH